MEIYIILLIISLAIIVYTTVSGGKDFAKLAGYKHTSDRQKIYRKWISESWLGIGAPALLGLLILSYAQKLPELPAVSPVFKNIVFGIAIGLIIILVLMIIIGKRQASGQSASKQNEIRKLIAQTNTASLIAINSDERKLAGWLSLAAGVNEELFFRALIPALLVGLLGAELSLVALIISTILFGIAHAYQGIGGMLATAVVGAIFLTIFVATGSLWLAILIHILLDFRGTVTLSWAAYGTKD